MLALQLGTSLSPRTFRARGQNLDIAEVRKSFTTYFAMAKQTSEFMLESLKRVSWLWNMPCTCIYRPEYLNVRCINLYTLCLSISVSHWWLRVVHITAF